MKKRYLVRPTSVVSMNDGDEHFISAHQLVRLHGVDPRECIFIHRGEDWPPGYGPLHTEELREAAGLKLLTPAYRGNYAEDI